MEQVFFPKFDALADCTNPLKRIKISPENGDIFFYIDGDVIAKIGAKGTVVYEGNVLVAHKKKDAVFTALLMEISSRAFGRPVLIKNVCKLPDREVFADFYEEQIHIPFASAAFDLNEKMLIVYLDAVATGGEPDVYFAHVHYGHQRVISMILPILQCELDVMPVNALRFMCALATTECTADNFAGDAFDAILINSTAEAINKKFSEKGLSAIEIYERLNFG